MTQLVARQWYIDAPYEARMENPSAWTKEMVGNFIEPSYSGTPEVKWDRDDEPRPQPINMEYLREIKPSSYMDELEVELKDGDTFRTKRIGTAPRNRFRCRREDTDEMVKFGHLEYERIKAVY